MKGARMRTQAFLWSASRTHVDGNEIDRLLRDERFDELARLGALPPRMVTPRRSVVDRVGTTVRSWLAPARRAPQAP